MAELLQEILESGRPPEEVCGDDPSLLAEVVRRLRRLRGVEAQLEQLFPSSSASGSEAMPDIENLPPIPRYSVESVLGRGGMGVVYRARHLRLNRVVALKMMLSGAYASAQERARFTREAESVAALRHPSIVEVYDVGDFEGRPFFTMELVEGGSLATRLLSGALPLRDAAALVATLAEAVEVAHRNGIAHRDLKPSNVLLAPDGTPKIADFGLARRFDGTNALTQTGTPVGTPSYMAPEQAAGHVREIGPRTDVYALGAILYETLTAQPPFRGESPAETQRQVLSDEPVAPSRLNSRVPRDLETICLECLHKAPARRYASAAALACDLNRFLRGEPIAARPTGPAERAWKWIRRRPTRAAIIAAATLVAVVALCGTLWLSWKRSVLAAEARADLDVAVAQLRSSHSTDARTSLERAKGRLGRYAPQNLLNDIAQIERDLALVAKLGDLRLQRSTIVGQALDEVAVDRGYQEVFEQAGIGSFGDVPAQVAARIAGSTVRDSLVAALDDWASFHGSHAPWILDVARRADPDPSWRDRVRTLAVEEDTEKLKDLAAVPSLSGQPVSTAILLSQRLRKARVNPAPFLRRLQVEHPDDFWVQFELACALDATQDPGAIECYRAALAIQPGGVAVLNNLGAALAAQRRFDESFECYEQLLRIDRSSSVTRLNYAAALAMANQFDRSRDHAREAVRLDPQFPKAHAALGHALWRLGAYAEALDASRRALELGLNGFAKQNTEFLVVDCGRRLALQDRLVGIVDGTDQPSTPTEAAEFANLCVSEGRNARAAALYVQAFEEQSSLADDILSGYRMNAAFAAATLGRDEGEGAALSDAGRAEWRARARSWLNDDLDLWTTTVERCEPSLLYEIRRRVLLVSEDPRLAGLRESHLLVHLPDAERRECIALWRAADALLFRIDHTSDR